MIRYALRCAGGHNFDSWFGSSGDYDRLEAAGLLACAFCGGGGVEKVLMAPAVGASPPAGAPDPRATERARPGHGSSGRPSSGDGASDPPLPNLSAPASPAERALMALRRRIEARAEHVGRDFAREARRIHEGEAPDRPIRGEAKPSEARALLEDGIPVFPLPWSSRKLD
ncbi:DUF1178 family protein [soil metagenome]